MGFSRQEYWSGLPCLPPGDLPDPGIEPRALMHWQTNSLPLALPGKPQVSHPTVLQILSIHHQLMTTSKRNQGDDNACINVNIGGGIRMCMLSCVQLFVTPWTASCQASLPMGFSRQEYWNGLPFPPPGGSS